MPDIRARPDKKMIDEAVSHLKGVWSATHVNWRLWDSYYNRQYSLWPKGKSREEYRPSTPANIVDHAADTQMAFDPRIHRDPVGESDNHKASADRLEKALLAILEDASLQETVIPFKQVGRHMLQYGYAPVEGPVLDLRQSATKPKRIDGEADSDYEERLREYRGNKGRNWNPIRVRATHPARILMDPREKQPELAIKLDRVYSAELVEMSEAKAKTRKFAEVYVPPKGKKSYDMVDVVHYWTPFWHAVSAGGADDGKIVQVLWAEKNTWGFIPFAHAFAGFGIEPANLQEVDPQYLARGVLEPVLESIKMQAQAASGKHSILIKAAYAPMGTTQDSVEAAQQLADGQVLEGEDGDFWWLKTPELPASLFRVGEEVDADIQRGTYTLSLAGVRESGVSTVGQQAILTTAAARKFASPKAQVDDLLAIVCGKILRMVDKVSVLNGAIGARGRSLRKTDIYGSYYVQAAFETVDPVLDMQRREQLMREVQLGLIDRETYWDLARYEDVSQLRRRRDYQVVRDHPVVAGKFAQVAAEEMGVGEEFEQALAEDEQLANQDGRRQTELEKGATLNGGSPSGNQTANPLRQPLTGDTVKPPPAPAG
jgi:hypothetical protein